jgi:linoleoyl-CoA desaturase
MARGLDLTGGSSYLWKYKHNGFHHNYSNIQDHDDDIEAGFLARLGPEQPRYWFHRYQHIYLWFIYGFVVIKWHIIDDFMNVWNAKIGQHTIKRPRGTELVVFIGGKVLFFILAFIIPSLVHPIWHVILFYLVTCWFMGTLIAIVFQLAHVVEEAEFPKPDAVTGNMTTGWAQHQVSTTMDFACQNRLLTWYLGGLNFQVVHHVLPTISHIHYPRVARIVKKACKKFNVKYNVQHTLFGAIRSHYRHLKKMGQPIPVS